MVPKVVIEHELIELVKWYQHQDASEGNTTGCLSTRCQINKLFLAEVVASSDYLGVNCEVFWITIS